MNDLDTIAKNKQISAAILLFIYKDGYTVEQAFDKVLGKGSYQRLKGELWEAFNANK
jgi:hypothetical protein